MKCIQNFASLLCIWKKQPNKIISLFQYSIFSCFYYFTYCALFTGIYIMRRDGCARPLDRGTTAPHVAETVCLMRLVQRLYISGAKYSFLYMRFGQVYLLLEINNIVYSDILRRSATYLCDFVNEVDEKSHIFTPLLYDKLYNSIE